jgi:hypothetical protein
VTFANSDQKTCTGCGTTCACGGNNKTSRSRGSFKSILIALLVLVGLQFGYGTLLLLTKEAAKRKVEYIPYTTHMNTRFGYSLCYDPNLFTQQPSTPKSDVEIFTSRDGHASFAVYGSVLGSWGLPQIFDMQVKSFTDQDPSAIVNGRALQPMSYDISATTLHTRQFENGLLQDGVIKRLRIQYDEDSAGTYSAAVGRMLECFHNTSPK